MKDADDEIIAKGSSSGGVFQLYRPKRAAILRSTSSGMETWHKRLGRVYIDDFNRVHYLFESERAQSIYEIVHSDVCGPMEGKSEVVRGIC